MLAPSRITQVLVRLVLLTATASGPSLGQITPAGGGQYWLKAKYFSREKFKYTVTVTIEEQLPGRKGPLYDISMPISMTVKKLSHGIANLVTKAAAERHNNAILDIGGTTNASVNAFNKTIAGKEMGFLLIHYPTHPLRVGDKWTDTMSFSFGTGNSGAFVATKSRLNGLGREANQDVVYIVAELSGYTSGRASFKVAAKDGTLISSTYSLQVNDPRVGVIPVSMTVKRIQ